MRKLSVILCNALFLLAITMAGHSAPSLDELGNISYSGIYENPVALTDGVYEGEPYVAGGSARPRVMLLDELLAADDINGDGTEDAWVLLSESAGGTGNYLYLAAVTRDDAGIQNIGTVRVGDRVDVIELTAADGLATLEYVTTDDGEPACCPTLIVTSTYGAKDGMISEQSQNRLGNLSLKQLEKVRWQLTEFAWNEPVPTGLSITAEFEDDRLSGFAGCNRYFATVKAPSPYDLSIGAVGSTRMACPPPQSTAEDRFLRALDNATQFSFMLGSLAITYRDADKVQTLLLERVATE